MAGPSLASKKALIKGNDGRQAFFRHEFDVRYRYRCGILAEIRRGDDICAEKRGGGLTTGMRSCIAKAC